MKSTLSSTSEIGYLDKFQAFNSLTVSTNDKNFLVRSNMCLMVGYIYSQGLFEFKASEIMKTDGIRKQAIGNYFYGFIQWNISKQGRNIKASHGKIIDM